jgi:Zn-finger nucleic acid-binding protein
LLETQTPEGVPIHRCAECEGFWLMGNHYAHWQPTQTLREATAELLNPPSGQSPPLIPSLQDARAALCPQCQHYLARAKVKYRTPFFLERCQECGGFWFDRGEWSILHKLGVSGSLEQFFDREWQMKLREQEASVKEWDSMVEKLGPELAQQVQQLAETLTHHAYGDYALAYLIRKAGHQSESHHWQGQSQAFNG